ncbi:uncharacterized protein LOC129581359 [Paramacrobiotus metropolitanus]|uniref:uncharacterized protein LOC129581359 n=1 Tax=Paramacrobiotus metropolitanus TaxID=2943436 RepID=UPI002445C664|nr:uncharacterized protein LOC129581359 [Paramacrobiotus metropolitanus]
MLKHVKKISSTSNHLLADSGNGIQSHRGDLAVPSAQANVSAQLAHISDRSPPPGQLKSQISANKGRPASASRVRLTAQFSYKSYGSYQLRPVLQKSVSTHTEFDHLRIRDIKSFIMGILFIGSFSSLAGMVNNIVRQSTEQESFYAPSFIVWHRFAVRIFTFPVYLCIKRLNACMFHGGIPERSFKEFYLDSAMIYGGRKVTFTKVFWDFMLLAALHILSQYGNWAPLYYAVSTGTVAALGASSFVFVFLLSSVFLDIKPIKTKVFGALLGLFGLAALALMEIVVNPKWYNSTAIIWGAISTALYQVVFKLQIGGTTHLGRIYFSITVMSVISTLLMWPMVLALKYSHVEVWDYSTLPLKMLFTTSSTNCLVIFLTNFAVSRINPLYTSVGFLMVVPITYLLDRCWNDRQQTAVDIIGATLVLSGVTLLIFADVLTWSSIRRGWKNVRGNLKMLRRYKSGFKRNVLKISQK